MRAASEEALGCKQPCERKDAELPDGVRPRGRRWRAPCRASGRHRTASPKCMNRRGCGRRAASASATPWCLRTKHGMQRRGARGNVSEVHGRAGEQARAARRTQLLRPLPAKLEARRSHLEKCGAQLLDVALAVGVRAHALRHVGCSSGRRSLRPCRHDWGHTATNDERGAGGPRRRR